MTTKKDPQHPHVIALSDKELAFITLCRRIGHGTIQTVGVVRGEPATCIGMTERIDLNKPDDLAKVMSGKVAPLTPSED